MDPIEIMQLTILFIILVIIYFIYKWVKKRMDLCKNDKLCYITGSTESPKIIQDVSDLF